ncbi:putative hydrolase [Marinomonas sp. MED121]|uniref:alpha/beta fold hydrolase n=1 Tax=Marinomonas sp. MED121 TaxID=314277 RepID=UPI0000690873|nr:alpha/beta hydrolase [Marinomonas sp. MED121]EAQ64548.1 putative hydrolase [Marinomonas sp. MED121]
MKTKLYLIPGTMCTQQLWQFLLPLLSDEFELCYLTIPNKMSLDDISDHLVAQFKEDRVNLLGFSLGGYIASLVASRFPERLDKLMVLANSPCALNADELSLRKQTVSILKRFGYKGMPRVKAEALLAEKSALHIDLILEMDKALGADTLLSQLENTSLRDDLMQPLLALDCDVRFIYSQKDSLINLAWMQEFNGLAGHKMSQKMVAGSSHMLPLEEPSMISREINTFFK